MTKKPRKRAEDTSWWVVFYDMNDTQKLPRKWTPVDLTKHIERENWPSLYRDVRHRGHTAARENAMMYNKMIANQRALVFYGSARPTTVTEWSVFDDDI